MKMPERSQILESVDQYEKRDPDLHRELRQKAAEPAADEAVFPIARKAAEVLEEIEPEPKRVTRRRAAVAAAGPAADAMVEAIAEARVDAEVTAYERRVAETIVRPSARPVLAVRNNKVTTEFLGPDSAVWRSRIDNARALLDVVIPSIGRIELKNNADFAWVGTGWLVADDIIVTNRHVAREFGRGTQDGFVFRVGVNGGPQSAQIDFLEEFDRSASLEFSIESILWIATPTEPDIAYLRVRPSGPARRLAPPIPLAETVSADDFVVTIGYPARDPRVPDQRLVQRIFGDVYEKKRLAPGQVTDVGPDELLHDCSTLGGNSGSPVISLKNGQAVGLHFSGLFLESNFAVPSPKVRELLAKAQRAELPGMLPIEVRPVPPKTDTAIAPPPVALQGGTYTFQFQIPVEITVKVGGSVVTSNGAVPGAPGTTSTDAGSIDAAVRAAREALALRSDVIRVRAGYRFKRGWITDERVVVVEVREKLSPMELRASSTTPIPAQFLGMGVDVRTAALPDQLEHLGIDLAALEAPPKPGGYQEPPNLSLTPVQERMKAIFHISPDSGFPNLRAFLGRVRRRLTATMYEWEAEHISDAIEQAIKPGERKLKMVTQLAGTREAVADMQGRLGDDKFDHRWASVGAGKLFPSAYHIKVASRDGEEFWLSSGNWKDSNQPNIDPAGENSTLIGPLRERNRDWHVIIENDKLAKMFQKYIEFDFKEAGRVPIEEALEAPLPELFVPEAAFGEELERRMRIEYRDPLILDKVLDVRPLLTPDKDARGRRMFLDTATKLIQRATRSVFLQNQSFNLLEENVDEFEQIFGALRDKQQAGLDVRIIFRDGREFSQANGPKQQELLERLKDFGFDTDMIRVQMRLHTKAIIIDPRDAANPTSGEVLFGSHNLTNAGALFNRDASLLVKDPEVTEYFAKAFLFDWDVLAKQDADELVGGVRVALAGEETPPGFRRVSLSEFLGEG
jgi:trypsin-like peptidase/phospholipase D-like protein